ncbi:hypothetical protein LAJ19_01900 [Deinococcus taeanensis]|uniref:hypothetical protein n=1 Tax=Deinococcus taeanensis TaxID=2737050 RepID=UPI001CDD6DCE|nr:hypothetical protein [Deinococcus taeanensis]UBV43003.1 hypothetical protein LAJ19_01900 [Deinococcus taeanensis]
METQGLFLQGRGRIHAARPDHLRFRQAVQALIQRGFQGHDLTRGALVRTTFGWAASRRSRTAAALKPAKLTEEIAPTRQHE